MKSGSKVYPVKVVEGRSEFIHLLLANAFGITGQDLGLNLIDGSSDGCKEQLPSHTDVLLIRRDAHLRHLLALHGNVLEQFITMLFHVCSKFCNILLPNRKNVMCCRCPLPPWCSWCVCCQTPEIPGSADGLPPTCQCWAYKQQ